MDPISATWQVTLTFSAGSWRRPAWRSALPPAPAKDRTMARLPPTLVRLLRDGPTCLPSAYL